MRSRERGMATSSQSPLSPPSTCPVCLKGLEKCDLGKPEHCHHFFCFRCILEWSKVRECRATLPVNGLLLFVCVCAILSWRMTSCWSSEYPLKYLRCVACLWAKDTLERKSQAWKSRAGLQPYQVIRYHG